MHPYRSAIARRSYVALLVLVGAACGNEPDPGSELSGGGASSSSHAGSPNASGAGAITAGVGAGATSGAGAAASMGAGPGGGGGASGAGNIGGGSGGGGNGGGGALPSVCPAGPFAVPDPGEPETVCTGFTYQYTYNEGPTWVASQGAFFFTNFVRQAAGGNVNGDIIKYTPGAGCERFIEDVGVNGLAVSSSGNLLGASHKSRAILEFDLATKQPTILADMYMGQLLDSPNDLVEHVSGSIFFTNPTFELAGRPPGIGPAIFWRDSAGVLTVLQQGGNQPNGIAISAEHSRLYVVNGGLWDLDARGAPSNKRSFTLNADGLAMDCAGNVYLSSGAIRSPQNEQIGMVPRGTNLAFGGPDGKTLFIVGPDTSTRVLSMNLPGLP